MQSMDSSQHIEERTIGVAGEEKTPSPQLQPRDVLTGHKKQSQAQGYIQPARGCRLISRSIHVGADLAASNLQRNAAGDQYQGVEVENWGKRKMRPIIGRS